MPMASIHDGRHPLLLGNGREMDGRWEYTLPHVVCSRSLLSPGRLPRDPPPSVGSPISLRHSFPSCPARVVGNMPRGRLSAACRRPARVASNWAQVGDAGVACRGGSGCNTPRLSWLHGVSRVARTVTEGGGGQLWGATQDRCPRRTRNSSAAPGSALLAFPVVHPAPHRPAPHRRSPGQEPP